MFCNDKQRLKLFLVKKTKENYVILHGMMVLASDSLISNYHKIFH